MTLSKEPADALNAYAKARRLYDALVNEDAAMLADINEYIGEARELIIKYNARVAHVDAQLGESLQALSACLCSRESPEWARVCEILGEDATAIADDIDEYCEELPLIDALEAVDVDPYPADPPGPSVQNVRLLLETVEQVMAESAANARAATAVHAAPESLPPLYAEFDTILDAFFNGELDAPQLRSAVRRKLDEVLKPQDPAALRADLEAYTANLHEVAETMKRLTALL